METKHLWEVKHPYYCNQGNYHARESVETEYRSFSDFMDEMGDADKDYNLVFRWDWKEENDGLESTFNGDVNYRNGKLFVFFMQQRRGNYVYSVIDVCRADEPAVIAYLQPYAEYMRELWQPLTFGA